MTAALAIFCAGMLTTTGEAQHSWAQSYGVGSYDAYGELLITNHAGSGHDRPVAVAAMPDGGFVVAGQIDFPEAQPAPHGAGGGANSSATLVRYAADGSVVWHQMVQQLNALPSAVHQVVTDAAGNIFIAGGKGPDVGFDPRSSGAPYVAKFSPDGALLWQNGIDWASGAAPFRWLALMPDGGVAAVGARSLVGSPRGAPMLAKFDANGAFEFQKVFKTDNFQIDPGGFCASQNGQRYVVLATYFERAGFVAILTDGAGEVIAQRQFANAAGQREEPHAVIPTAEGGFVAMSRLGDSFNGYYGAIVRKLDGNLNPIFEKRIELPGQRIVADSLSQTADGGFLIGGDGVIPFQSVSRDAVLLKLTPAGAIEWASVLGGPDQEGVSQFLDLSMFALQAADGGYFFAGTTLSYKGDASSKPDWWVVKTNANRRVTNYPDLQIENAASDFTAVDITSSPEPPATFHADGTLPSNVTSAPALIPVDLGTKTGINKPRVDFQGSSLPRIVSSDKAEAIIGQHFSYRIETDFTTPGATLTYSATGLPPNFKINSRTGVISGAPRPGSATTEPLVVTLQVSDGTATSTFRLRLSITVGPPSFRVNGSNQPAYPGSAAAVTGLADQALRFAADYGGRQAGQFVGVQVSTNPADPGSWQKLGNATEGFMILDVTTQSYVLTSTAYPRASAVYFRTHVKTPGRADAVSNVVGPFDLSSTTPRLDKTKLYITRNGPVANIRFGVTQDDPPAGVAVRLQATTNPASETAWADVPAGNLIVDPEDGRQFYKGFDDYPVGDGVYFRAIATASGYVQSISGPQGPFTFIFDPAAQVTITIPDSGGSGGASFNNPLTPSSNTFQVVADAVGAGRQLRSLNLLYDGDRIDRFLGGTTHGATQYTTSVPGHHLIEAVAIDDLGVTGHARPVHVHVRPSGGKIYKRTASGIWADPTLWTDEQGGDGIPGANDFAVLSGFDVNVVNDVTLRAFSVNGGKITGAGKITVTGFATLGAGSIRNNMEISVGATLLLINDEDIGLGGTVVNRGRTKFHGRGGVVGVPVANPGVDGREMTSPDGFIEFIKAIFVNAGKALFHPPAGGRAQTPPAPSAPEARVIIVEQIQNQGELKLIGQDGSGILANDGASIFSNSAQGLVDPRGNPIVSGGGGNVVAVAAPIVSGGGGNIVSGGGGNLVAVGGSNIVSGGGGNIVSGGGGNRPSLNKVGSAGPNGTTPTPGVVQSSGELDLTGLVINATVQLNGGSLTGKGAIIGDVTNDGALVSPGNSPGSVAVTGSFTQNTSGILKIEAAGGAAQQFDQLQVGGSVALGGTLDLRMIGGYVPLPDDAFVPLGYGTVTGQFHTVSSNAQVSVTPTGIVTVLDPAAAPPFALLRAVSRKTHGTAGPFDANLPVSGSIGVEPRRTDSNGEHQLVLTFSEAVSIDGVAVTGGSGMVSSATLSGAELTVNLTGVSNGQILTIGLTNVNNGFVSISPSVPAGFLLGDTNGDRVVNGGDAIQTRSRSGQAVDGTNFRSDVNTDGNINGGDSIIVRGRSGSSVSVTGTD